MEDVFVRSFNKVCDRSVRPQIEAPMLAVCPLQDISFSKLITICGGGDIRGVRFYFSSIGSYEFPSTRYPKHQIDVNCCQHAYKMTIDQFKSGPSMIVGGVVFGRHEIIKYISHSLGGVHFKKPKEREVLLEWVFENVGFSNVLDAICYEFLSISQFFIRSKAVSDYLSATAAG